MGQVISYIVGFCSSHDDPTHNDDLILVRFRSKPGLNDIVDTTNIDDSLRRVVEQKRRVAGIPEVNPSKGCLDDEEQSCVVLPDDANLTITDRRGKAPEEAVEVIKERVSIISDKSEKKLPGLSKEKWIKHYCSSHKILLVGEGDFSFSACLAKAFRSAHNMVATSLDSIDFLEANYKNAIPNITKLKKLGCMVIHEFDATKMSKQPVLEGMQFERIVYNFPLVGLTKNSRERGIRRNQHLVEHFFRHAKKMITEEGEIHISHKSYGFFLEWNIKDLASKCGLELKEEVEFNLSDYPGYSNKFGFGGDDSFNCFKSKTYKFEPKAK